MEYKLEKSIKRFLKRKIKITLEFIVAFLLSCNFVSADVIEIKYENGNIVISHEIEGNTFDKTNNTYTNNNIIIGTGTGIEIDYTITKTLNFNFINSGKISGNFKTSDGILNSYGVINELRNYGIASGNTAIGNFSGEITNLRNYKIISGNSIGIQNNGIYNTNTKIENLENYGIISGNSNGINNLFGTITDLGNYGIISSNDHIAIENMGVITDLRNYGIIGGEKSHISGTIAKQENYGLLISGTTIEAGTGGKQTIDGETKYIINGTNGTGKGVNALAIKSSELSQTDNLIINVIGEENTAFNIDEETKLSDSTINGYKNAVALSEHSFTGENITVNAKENAFIGDDKSNTLELINSIINGNIDLGAGDDTITFSNLTLFENTKITNTENIVIGENSSLNLRLGKTDKTETIENDNVPVAEHALDSNNSLTIKGLGKDKTTGKLNFITNGIGQKIYVPLENLTVENLKIGTSSVIDSATIGDNYILLGAGENLGQIFNPSKDEPENPGDPDTPKPPVSDVKRYEALDKVYRSIYNSGNTNIDSLRNILSFAGDMGEHYESVSEEVQLERLVKYLKDVYSYSPYAFSSDLSRKSAEMFRDIITDNSSVPEYKKWLIMGGLTHKDGGTENSYYGKNYHNFDTGTAEIKADSKLTGAYVLGKYRYSDKISFGITAGGNKGETELSNSSKIDGNAGYLGIFAENYRGNLTVKTGAGVQYSEYDSNRKALNSSYSDKYSDMAYDIYGSLKYSLPLENNLFLEPYTVLSYTYIDQEGADEENKALAIETDDKSFDYTNLKAGVNLKKIIPLENKTHIFTAGVSYDKVLHGSGEDYITGRMKNGTDFDILVHEKQKSQFSLNGKYELETEKGILFDIRGSYSFEHDTNQNEWTVGTGIGYKF